MQKLDPAIQSLVEAGEPVEGQYTYDQHTREDGTTVYSVILRTDEPEALRDAELPVQSVLGRIVTARLSIEQIKTAARLDAVDAIQNGGEADYPETVP